MMDRDSRVAKRDKRSQLAIIAVQWWQWQVVAIAAILWLLVMVDIAVVVLGAPGP